MTDSKKDASKRQDAPEESEPEESEQDSKPGSTRENAVDPRTAKK